ncbi:MAG: TonB C-terminal domain-containing protein [Candidatus Saccharicenans sp.]|nr:TonB C-terminal domain-containing protein [Candidatus Saccharicenans sp.]
MRSIKLKPSFLRLTARWRRMDRSEAWPKVISLTIAILLHVLLILYLKQAKIIVKILPFIKETDVVIATYPEASPRPYLPEVIKEPPVTEAQAGGQPGRGEPTGRGKPGGRPGAEAPGVAGTTSQVSGSGQPSVPFDLEAYLAAGRSETRTPSGVRINLSRIRPVSGKYRFSLKLPVRPEPEPGEVGEAPPSIKSDVLQYAAPRAYEKPGRGLHFTEAGRARPGVPGTVTPQAVAGYRYNIKPWAERVVNLVQSRWILPQLSVMPKNKNVALILLVDRDGQLQSLEIATSTTSEILDQAALTAVRLCAPFPPLPEDFPGKSLEFYLVFTYHD